MAAKGTRHADGPATIGTMSDIDPREIGPEPVESVAEPGAMVASPLAGSIEIAVSGGVRIRIEGAVDPAAVTAAVAAVMKARRRR